MSIEGSKDIPSNDINQAELQTLLDEVSKIQEELEKIKHHNPEDTDNPKLQNEEFNKKIAGLELVVNEAINSIEITNQVGALKKQLYTSSLLDSSMDEVLSSKELLLSQKLENLKKQIQTKQKSEDQPTNNSPVVTLNSEDFIIEEVIVARKEAADQVEQLIKGGTSKIVSGWLEKIGLKAA